MSIWANVFSERYDCAIAQLAMLIEACPDEHWSAPVWQVQSSDRHVWPIVRGMGADLPDEERLQLQAAFWNIVVHALHALDVYLDGGVAPAVPPPPFDTWQMPGHILPDQPPTRQQLLDYLASMRTKAHRVLDHLTDADAARPARRGRPFGDLLVHELVHRVHLRVRVVNAYSSQSAGVPDSVIEAIITDRTAPSRSRADG